jgi:iron complex outermembrane receptor protein
VKTRARRAGPDERNRTARRGLRLIAALCAQLWAAIAAAQEDNTDRFSRLSLEELLDVDLVSVTKERQPLSQAPGVVTVITAEQIRAFGYQSVSSALESVPGLDLIHDYLQPNLGIRGISGGMRGWSRVVKVMIDGLPVAFRPTSEHWLDEELIPIAVVDRIEVIRGPLSALYGANAYLGVINIITVSGDMVGRSSAGGKLSYERGHVGYGGTFTSGGSTGGWTWLAAANFSMSDRAGYSPVDIPGRDDFSTDNRTEDDISRPFSLFAKAHYRSIRLELIGIDVSLQNMDRRGEFQDWGLLTHQNQISLLNLYARGQLQLRLAPAVLAYQSVTYSLGAPTHRDRLETFRDRSVTGDWVERDVHTNGLDLVESGTFEITPRDKIIIGADQTIDYHDPLSYRYVFADPDGQRVTMPFGDNTGRTFINLGVYAQAMLKPLGLWREDDPERLGLTLGMRFDHQSEYGNSLNYRLGTTYQLGRDLYAKLLLGTSFKAPAPAQLYTKPLANGDVIANPDLQPERARTLELVLGGAAFGSLRFSLDGFFTIVDDKVELRSVNNDVMADNVAQIRSLGGEAEATYLRHGLEARLGVGYQHSTVARSDRAGEAGSAVPLYPSWKITASLTEEIPRAHLAFGVEATYVSARQASAENVEIFTSENYPLANAPVPYHLENYGLVDLVVSSRDLNLLGERNTELTLKVSNLLGSHYVHPGFTTSPNRGFDIPGRERTFLFSVQQQL